MSETPLNIAFIWHMHQPYYKDLRDNHYHMPWVRLHGVKDYYDMVAILDDYPQIHQTFNLVPSLIEQIDDYAKGGAYDRHLLLTERPADQLNQSEKEEIVSDFFICNYQTMIKPYPRFNQLFLKRGEKLEDIKTTVKRFTAQDILDLQVWSNLAWIDPIFHKESEIAYLLKKKRNFSEEDKRLLVDKQRDILRRILPKYDEVKSRGQIEITISPYYHPILPLIYDVDSAKVALPGIKLPEPKFSHPEDAEKQIQMGVELYERKFKDKPKGLWPSEGAVSQEIVPLLVKHGIKWIATDEEILRMSLLLSSDKGKSSVKQKSLHRAYTLASDQKQLHIIFRDHLLSDLIGFVYSKWESRAAVEDFISKLHRLREILSSDLKNSLVSIILDGENCWEYYPNDGRDFLSLLYAKLSSDELIRTVKVSEFLEQGPQVEMISRLFAGSWINHDFRIWIGHPEDKLAWQLLKMTRDALTEYEKKMGEGAKPETLEKAWKAIYVAEGSDWCWWYGDEHQSPSNDQFDRLFRSHLLYVYELIQQEPPDVLYRSIRAESGHARGLAPTGYITPTLDGRNTHYYEWQAAGFFDCLKDGGAMHKATSIVKGIYYGLDQDKLYFRIDTFLPPHKYLEDAYVFSLEILEPDSYVLSVQKETPSTNSIPQQSYGGRMVPAFESVVESIIELAIPLGQMEFKGQKMVGFQVAVKKDNKELERYPHTDLIRLEIPAEKGDRIFWQV